MCERLATEDRIRTLETQVNTHGMLLAFGLIAVLMWYLNRDSG